MKFLKDLEFDPDKPYESDLLNRKTYGDALTDFISRVEDGCVIAIDSKWGEGKTTFVKWWADDLAKKEHHPIYFDAFQHDYNSEPLIALTKTLFSHFPDPEAGSKSLQAAYDKLRDDILPSMLKHLSFGLAMAAFGPAGGLAAGAAGAGASFISETTDYLLKKGSEEKTLEETMEDFRSTLGVITDELYLKGKGRLVFIIDELDRCRPTYALEMIEKVKHMFSVPGVIWVLVMNKQQLEKSIEHAYGTVDSCYYLNKFINVQTALPKSTSELENVFSSSHYDSLIRGLLNATSFSYEIHQKLVVELPQWAREFKFSIRECQRLVFYLELILGKERASEWRLCIGMLLASMKIADEELFRAIERKETVFGDLAENKILSNLFSYYPPYQYYVQFALCRTAEEVEQLSLEGQASELLEQRSINEFREFCKKGSLGIVYSHCHIQQIGKVLNLFSPIVIKPKTTKQD